MWAFGVGNVWVTQQTDAFGNAIANPTPLKVGELQDNQIDISRDIKELIGQNQFPVAIAVGKSKLAIKTKFARVNGLLLNSLFFGQGVTAGTLTSINNDTTGAAIPASPYQITVAPPSSGTFVRDLGVIDTNGNPLVEVASAPATGQYAVTTGGQYTFAAADTGKLVFINYEYTSTLSSAKQVAFKNLPMGQTPVFGVDLAVGYNGKFMTWRFPNCVSGKITLGTKLDDFTSVDTDINAFSDGAGNVAYTYLPE